MKKSNNLGGMIGLTAFTLILAMGGFVPFAIVVFVVGMIFISQG